MIDLNALDLSDLWPALVDQRRLRTLLELARDEDLGAAGDVTSRFTIEAGRRGRALVRARRPGVVAGLPALATLLDVFAFDGVLVARSVDGRQVEAGAVLAELEGDLRGLLALERTLLNLLGRLCGIATTTRRHVDAVAGAGASRAARICDTRKTTPGLRALEKYAVRCGGGWMHRLGLDDAMLVKDNHLAGLEPEALARTVAEAARRARAAQDLRFVEVEVDALEQLAAILRLPEGTVDMVLLDNMDLETMRRAVAMRGVRPTPLLEASGGLTLDRLRAVAETGVDRISIGALTHSAASLDVGMDVE